MHTAKQAAAKARICELQGRIKGLRAQWGRYTRPSSHLHSLFALKSNLEHGIVKLNQELQTQHSIELSSGPA